MVLPLSHASGVLLTPNLSPVSIPSWLVSLKQLLAPKAATVAPHPSPNPVFSQPLELLCEKSIGTANRPMGAGEALRRVLECLASGIVMPG